MVHECSILIQSADFWKLLNKDVIIKYKNLLSLHIIDANVSNKYLKVSTDDPATPNHFLCEPIFSFQVTIFLSHIFLQITVMFIIILNYKKLFTLLHNFIITDQKLTFSNNLYLCRIVWYQCIQIHFHFRFFGPEIKLVLDFIFEHFDNF